MSGLIHLYYGDGKGKTTAATGLALRAAGAGMKVLFVQFLKDGSSPEMEMLRQRGLIETDCCSSIHKFVFQMSGEERRQAEAEYSRLLENSLRRCNEGYGLLVLDEVIPACNMGIVPRLLWRPLSTASRQDWKWCSPVANPPLSCCIWRTTQRR